MKVRRVDLIVALSAAALAALVAVVSPPGATPLPILSVLIMAGLPLYPISVLTTEAGLLAIAVFVPVAKSEVMLSAAMVLIGLGVVAYRYAWVVTAVNWACAWVIPVVGSLLRHELGAAWTANATKSNATPAQMFALKPAPLSQIVAEAMGLAVLTAVSVALGRLMRWRRCTADERAAEAEAREALKARADVFAERTRLARDLHDTVAHHVGAMTLRASTARLALDSGADHTVLAEALDDVAATGRRVLAELRELLSMLRDPDAAEGDGLLPDPEAAMTEVVQRMRAAGLPVEVEIDSRLAEVSTLVRVTLARVIREALTNVLKHAGPGTPSVVKVIFTPPGSLRALVRNDKPARAVPILPPSGHGLAGMRELVALLGGVLAAGPTPERGWAVTVELPARVGMP